jgi:branched-chain amino acid transport system substrate-binding protein
MSRHRLQHLVISAAAVSAGLISASLFLLPLKAHAEDGVSADQITFGQSAALSGPSKDLGLAMRFGILAAFDEVNRQGGVKGRKLRLISKDDGYEPEDAARNTREFIKSGEIFALIGNVGTPTAKASQPLTTIRQVPFIAPFTGAAFLRRSELSNVINIRASYEQEAEAWARYVVDSKKLKRIAIFYQDDSYGHAGLDGLNKALEKRNMRLVAKGVYHRNQLDVQGAVNEISLAKPEVVAMVGSYKACAEFIRRSKEIGVDGLFINLSFVGSRSLSKALGPHKEGVIISEVVPNPRDSSLVTRKYRQALGRTAPSEQPGFVSLEGYIAGRLVTDVIKRIDGKITRAKFLSTLKQSRWFNIDELKLEFGPGDNQGLDVVHLTIIEASGEIRSITDLAPIY